MMEGPFRLELTQYFSLLSEGRHRDVDPAWLALLAVLLA